MIEEAEIVSSGVGVGGGGGGGRCREIEPFPFKDYSVARRVHLFDLALEAEAG